VARPILVLLLAGCLVLPALALAADTDPQERYTAADKAKARSLLLKRGDLVAGWKQSPAAKADDSSDDYKCAGYDPDLSDLTETGEAEVEFSHRSGAMIFSYASLMKSPEQAVVSWRRGNTPAFARCLAQVVTQGLSDADADAKVTSYGRMPFPKLAPRVAAFKVAFTVSAPEFEKPVPFTFHVVILGSGRAEVALIAMAPFAGLAAADLRALGNVLAERMAAAKV
jgi:hypothetical protein